MAKKPILFGDTRTETEISADRFQPIWEESFDPSYIPGYSEKVRANDIARADELFFRQQHSGAKPGARKQEDWYRKIGAEPGELPVEFKGIRVEGPNGGPSHTANWQSAYAMEYEGFRPVTRTELEAMGYGMPPAWREDEAGYIRRYDLQLMVRDGKVARRHEADNIRRAKEAENAPLDSFSDGGYVAPAWREEMEHEQVYLKEKE